MSAELAAPPTVEPLLHCIHYINKVITQYRNAHQAHQESLLQLDTHLFQIQQFTNFATSNYNRLDSEIRALCKRLLSVIEGRLIDFVSVLSSLTDPAGNVNKAVFALRGRDALAGLHRDVVSWEGSLNSVLFASIHSDRQQTATTLAHSSANNCHKTHLDKLAEMLRHCFLSAPSPSLRLDPGSVDTTNFAAIPYSGAMYSEHPTPVLLETHTTTATEEDVRDIAAFLSNADPTVIGLLQCRSFHTHTLLFDLPLPTSHPVSLQSVLLDAHTTGPQHDLSTRLQLMRRIASCIFFVHTANHVHKSIRTSNILLLSANLPDNLGEAYLVGFDLSRKSQQASNYTRTSDWWDAYYLPPDRQGDTNRAYTMLDDVYSFGVVLLELCLWRPFARRRKSAKPPHAEKWVRGSDMLDLSDAQQPRVLGPEELRQMFLELARKRVRVVMGSVMSELVVACLSCVQDESAFGKRKELEDDDGVVMGVAYTRQVIRRLEAIAC